MLVVGINITPFPTCYFSILFTLDGVYNAAGKLFSLLVGFCPSQNGPHGIKLLNIVPLHISITLSYLLCVLSIDTWEM